MWYIWIYILRRVSKYVLICVNFLFDPILYVYWVNRFTRRSLWGQRNVLVIGILDTLTNTTGHAKCIVVFTVDNIPLVIKQNSHSHYSSISHNRCRCFAKYFSIFCCYRLKSLQLRVHMISVIGRWGNSCGLIACSNLSKCLHT